ncbi:MAG: methylenetetrahydrofolate dehydrogenase (NADP+) / methenyltetrahydrofolate cyclohydrolase [Candidatus Saganbacteria bacterium]|uniref:Bifunctional protein FolD n=1 Tax=Candidatus Saganbacteria bacterium TaxID=2575572 RepID=A0A833L202_UNCSA|nr:MAG: methylenetetrahydrofolate dehydrogenase (NADP+) / methenyltetrahydrofolate cyclohydrolase [Candidatus Saganbacteria bacterium]
MAVIINGKNIADSIKEELKEKIEKLKLQTGITPKLSVILVGDNPASCSYVKGKEKACREAGIISNTVKFSSEASEKEIIQAIEKLNTDDENHGILVQLPLPKNLNENKIINSVNPEKDVDGLHVNTMGKLLKGMKTKFYPCTPMGVVELILSTGMALEGKEVVVVGRSNIVGKPLALMLLEKNATVTICHSKTKDLKGVCSRADILVAAVGRSGMIKSDWIKKGATVIDVGINRVDGKLVGDVDFENVKEMAGYISPVPGGVGPMTIAMLLKNTFISAAGSA